MSEKCVVCFGGLSVALLPGSTDSPPRLSLSAVVMIPVADFDL